MFLKCIDTAGIGQFSIVRDKECISGLKCKIQNVIKKIHYVVPYLDIYSTGVNKSILVFYKRQTRYLVTHSIPYYITSH